MISKYHPNEKSQVSATEGTRHIPPEAGGRSLPGVSPGGGASLPCLYSNISIENENQEALKGLISLLSPYWKKAAQTLYLNVERLIKEAESLGHVGFLTLTFKDNVTDNKEASSRLNSLNSNFLNKDPRFKTKIITKEPQKRGAWHYHILIILSEDIRDGFDFEAIAKGDYRSANQYLRDLWKDIRCACERYGFGRSELMPVKSNATAMGRYIGKYISKGLESRNEDHKGVRLVNYSKGWTRNSAKFAWNTTNSAEWRRKVEYFARLHGCTEMYQLTEKLGPGWCHRYLDEIVGIYEKLYDHLIEWKYEFQPEDTGASKGIGERPRANRETGEVQKPDQYEHKDKVFKAISKNDKDKKALIEAELKGTLGPRSTHKENIRRRRKKEKDKNYVNYQLLALTLEQEKIKNEQKRTEKWLKTLPEAPF